MRNLQLGFITNQSTKRIFRLLDIIERDRQFTIGDLAKEIGVTQRTIGREMKYIKEYFAGCVALTSGNSGNFFEEIQPSMYQDKKRDLLKDECLFGIIRDIFYGNLNDVGELAHTYHFSESTFRRILSQCAPILQQYGLDWVSNPLSIVGEEAGLRKFFKDFYYEGGETLYTFSPDDKLHRLILKRLNNSLGNYENGTGTTINSFYYNFYIAIRRASQGHQVKIPEQLKKTVFREKEFLVLYTLKEDIEILYGFKLAKEEFCWVYLVAICKRTIDKHTREQYFYERFNLWPELAGLVMDFLSAKRISEPMINEVGLFLRSFFLSRKINNIISPCLNKEMSDIKDAVIRYDGNHYQENLSFLYSKIDVLNLPKGYIEDVCLSLTLYSNLIFDVYSPKKNIFFLLEGDHFVCQHIRMRAIQQFGNKHTLTFLPLQHITKELLNKNHVDLIVSNYSRYIQDYVVNTDYILLKSVPDDRDWKNLEKKVDPYRKHFF
ncbi:helix-turn-helix domain-containing protein [Enterococcus sp. DIV0840c]|uniref:helix-turn-helix domain-containing protein n=1 Tax=Enterococcus sp. DIV0840c TaxID=2774772 RepID=UPI003D285DCE